MTHVCDIRELPTIRTVRHWARAHGAAVEYLGTTLEGQAVYAAQRGPVVRVARSTYPDPHPRPIVWHSPLETVR